MGREEQRTHVPEGRGASREGGRARTAQSHTSNSHMYTAERKRREERRGQRREEEKRERHLNAAASRERISQQMCVTQ